MKRAFTVIALSLLCASCSVQQRADVTNDDWESQPITDEEYEQLDPEAPFIVEAEKPTATASTIAVRLKPGIPYITENPEGAVPCMDEPTKDARGTLTFPVSAAYANLPILGQLLTARDCGPKRVAQLPSVKEGTYTAGSVISLKAVPEWPLRDALEDIGYACALRKSPVDCKQWELKKPVEVDAFARLVPFTADIQKEACVACWQ